MKYGNDLNKADLQVQTQKALEGQSLQCQGQQLEALKRALEAAQMGTGGAPDACERVGREACGA